MKYFLCFGSNLGKKRKNLRRALSLLEKEGIKVLRSSSLYKTEPKDVPHQPWFYNQVVEAETDLNPKALLRLTKNIEQIMGRKASGQKGPRIIDIDILLAGDTVISTEELVIPHPRMEKRNFVLSPLREISPGTVHPLLKKTIEDLWKNSKDRSYVEKIR